MIVLIDNYDSFVYNLSRYLVEMGCETRVIRNDHTTLAQLRSLDPQAVVVSPGPGAPRQAGISVEVVRELGAHIPMCGVCLGHQAVVAAFGGEIVRSGEPVHGRTSLVHHNGQRLFAGVPNPLQATRYHSLIVAPDSLPECLDVTARTEDGIVMAVEHRSRPVFGVQFHPESVLTQCGHQLLANFLELSGIPHTAPPQGDYVGSSELGPTLSPKMSLPDWPPGQAVYW